MHVGEKLGEGGEAEIFALDGDRVLRRFRSRDADVAGRVALTREVADATAHLPFATPEILESFLDDDGVPCLIERRLPGRSMTDALGDLGGDARRRLLTSFLEVGTTIGMATFERPWFGELIADPDALRCSTWSDYLHSALDRNVGQTDRGKFPELDHLDELVADTHQRIDAVDIGSVEPGLVHFDYFGGNVLCDDVQITAVIDWSVLSIAGDPRLDVALSVGYLGLTPNVTAADIAWAEAWLADRMPADLAALYRRWGALWWLVGADDARLRDWVVATLT